MEELKALVKAAQAGDLDAFGKLVQRFQDMAYGYGLSLLGDYHLAQDAAQEAFIDAFRYLPSLKEPGAFTGWFRKVIHKHCDRIKRKKVVKTTSLDSMKDVPAPSKAKTELRDQVLAAVKALPAPQRDVTTLFYINGYSQAEVADFLAVPVTTVKKRLHDARKKLKERILGMVSNTLKETVLDKKFAKKLIVELIARFSKDPYINNDVLFILERQLEILPEKVFKQLGDAWMLMIMYPHGGRWVWSGGNNKKVWALIKSLSRDKSYGFAFNPDQRDLAKQVGQYWKTRWAGINRDFIASYNDIKKQPKVENKCIKELKGKNLDLVKSYPDKEVNAYEPRIKSGWVKAFGYIHNKQLVAFLAMVQDFSNIWGISYIHTIKAYRKKGIAKALLRYVRSKLLKPGDSIMYNVYGDKPASVNTALSAGLRLLKERYNLMAEPKSKK